MSARIGTNIFRSVWGRRKKRRKGMRRRKRRSAREVRASVALVNKLQ